MNFDKKTGLKKNVQKRYRDGRAYKLLTKDKVEMYLTARPEKLCEMHNELYSKIKNEAGEIDEIDIQCIKSVFCYSAYFDKNKKMSYALAKLIGVNTCTYCNRIYTMTVDNTKDGDDYIIRPEFDHWFSQTDYPDLALSYYNLIPSCHICNSNLKLNQNMKLNQHIHPYIDRKAGFSFTYIPTSLGPVVDIEKNQDVDNIYYERVKNTLEIFKIPQIYATHSGFELKDLLDLATNNHPDYISTLVNKTISELKLSEEDVYRMLFGIEINEEHYLKRPMSKFKSDIIKKIKNDLKK